VPREEDPAPLWTVFDPEGRVLGFVETPKGLDILQIGEDFILGRFEDEFEVENVQVWCLERCFPNIQRWNRPGRGARANEDPHPHDPVHARTGGVRTRSRR